MTTNYLGVHIGHNASCALMVDGKIVAAAEEERFTRRKNEMGFPENAILYCLNAGGVNGTDINTAAYGSKYFNPLEIKAKTVSSFSLTDYHDFFGEKYYAKLFRRESGVDYLEWLRDDPKFNQSEAGFDFSFLDGAAINDLTETMEDWRQSRVIRLSEFLGIDPEQVKFLDHHTCHAHYAYFASPLGGEDAAVVILDSMGDGRNLTVWRATENVLSLMEESDQNDIGRLYRMVTLILGMRPLEHEYKVMGLAPYAKQEYAEACLKTFEHISRVDGLKIVENDRPQDLYEFLRDVLRDQRFDNVGAAAQLFTEHLAVQLVTNIHDKTGLETFALSGGISMNVKMNQKIADLDCVSELHVPASGADESLSIGACYVLNAKGVNQPLNSMYLGYDSSNDINSIDVDALASKFIVTKNVGYNRVAEHLAAGAIVAIINGRGEFGQRALGNRSILGDPSRRDTVQRINEAVKKRDFWMPFAVSILEEHADRYIINPKSIPAKYMAVAFNTIDTHYEEIVSGTHPYDHSVRPQLVSTKTEPHYHRLISEFYEQTGIPALLNTSFNLHGEPIVNTVAEALHTFEVSGIDHLLIEDMLVSKNPSS